MTSLEYYLKHDMPVQTTGLPKLEYALPVDSKIVLEVYNLSGERIMTLVDKNQAAGRHYYDLNRSAKKLSSGTYYCRMAAYDDSSRMQYVNVRKLVINRY